MRPTSGYVSGIFLLPFRVRPVLRYNLRGGFQMVEPATIRGSLEEELDKRLFHLRTLREKS